MPGVLMVEALAQTGAVAILSWKKTKARLHTLAGSRTADSVEKLFRGIKLRLETTIIKCKGPVGVGHAVASVDGKVVVDAELTFMIG